MGDPNEFFVPARPQNIAMRPLDKGIFLNVSPVLIPQGGALDIANMHVIQGGLKRRAGVDEYAVNSAGVQQPLSFGVRGCGTLWRTDGTSAITFWDTKMLYTFSTGTWNRKLWQYQTGTCSVTALSVTGAGTGWLSATTKVQSGDLISFGTPRSGIRRITAVATGTKIFIDSTPGGAPGTGNYKIRRCFGAIPPYMVDVAVVDNQLIFTDSTRPPFSFDGTTFTEWAATHHASITKLVASSICFFNNRTWLGRTVETAGGTTDYRQRIRWSRTTAHANFTDAAAADTQWINLPYSKGWMMRFAPMGDMLAAFFSDAIYLGIATNIPGLPLMFNKLETGGIGLIGMGAVGSFLGTVFFVGNDDIYMLRSQGIERIGTPVVKKTILTCNNPDYIRVAVDPLNDRICFGFSENGESIAKVWSYFYKSKAWTYDEIECTMMGLLDMTSGPTWDTLGGLISPVNWDVGIGAKYTTWDSMKSISTGFRLVFGKANGTVFQLSTSDPQDSPGTPIPVRLEFGDYDYDDADTEKCWIRFGLKLREATATQLNLLVEVSSNRGISWKNVGNLIIRVGEDEGYVNFRQSGAMIRLRVTSSDVAVPYTIDEAVLRVRGKGLETRAVSS